MARMERRTPAEAKQLMQQINALDGLRVSVGWFPSAKYPDGTPVAQAMAVSEFGFPPLNIPPRSFMRTTAAAQSGTWAETAEMLGRRVLQGKMTTDQLAEGLGMMAVGDIQRTISQITDPPLSERTLADRRARGNSNTKPLVDTRVAFNTLTFTIEGS